MSKSLSREFKTVERDELLSYLISCETYLLTYHQSVKYVHQEGVMKYYIRSRSGEVRASF